VGKPITVAGHLDARVGVRQDSWYRNVGFRRSGPRRPSGCAVRLYRSAVRRTLGPVTPYMHVGDRNRNTNIAAGVALLDGDGAGADVSSNKAAARADDLRRFCRIRLFSELDLLLHESVAVDSGEQA
jgi:hypothetical protein